VKVLAKHKYYIYLNNVNLMSLICIITLFFIKNSVFALDPVQQFAKSKNDHYEALSRARAENGGKLSVEQEDQIRAQYSHPAEERFYIAYSEAYFQGLEEAKLRYRSEKDLKKQKEMALWNEILEIKSDDPNVSSEKNRKIAQEKSSQNKKQSILFGSAQDSSEKSQRKYGGSPSSKNRTAEFKQGADDVILFPTQVDESIGKK
jgi:hypothetical protein